MKSRSMPVGLALRARLVGTLLEGPMRQLRWATGTWHRNRHPELWPIHLEERYISETLGRLLDAQSCVLDVGCHVGSFLTLALRYAPQGQHAAIEASEAKSKWLQARFPNVTIHACAVADHVGTSTFEENLDAPGFSKLSQDAKTAGKVYYEVKVSTIDTLMAGCPKLNLIKLDIEGAELAALRGASATIAQHRPALIFECGPEYSYRNGREGRLALFNYVSRDLGYRIFSFSDYVHGKGELTESEFVKSGIYPFPYFNFLALPREKQDLEPQS